MKIMGMRRPSKINRFRNSAPLMPGSQTSVIRQPVSRTRPDFKKSSADAKRQWNSRAPQKTSRGFGHGFVVLDDNFKSHPNHASRPLKGLVRLPSIVADVLSFRLRVVLPPGFA